MWEAVTNLEATQCGGLLRQTLANGARVVEGIVLKAAWHWDANSSVVNDPLGEPSRSPLYVGLPSAWGSVDGDCMFLT